MSGLDVLNGYYADMNPPAELGEVVKSLIDQEEIGNWHEREVKCLLKVAKNLAHTHWGIFSVKEMESIHDRVTGFADDMGPGGFSGHLYGDVSHFAMFLEKRTREAGWWLETGRDVHEAVTRTVAQDPLYAMGAAHRFAGWSLKRSRFVQDVLSYQSMAAVRGYISEIMPVLEIAPVTVELVRAKKISLSKSPGLLAELQTAMNGAIYINRR